MTSAGGALTGGCSSARSVISISRLWCLRRCDEAPGRRVDRGRCDEISDVQGEASSRHGGGMPTRPRPTRLRASPLRPRRSTCRVPTAQVRQQGAGSTKTGAGSSPVLFLALPTRSCTWLARQRPMVTEHAGIDEQCFQHGEHLVVERSTMAARSMSRGRVRSRCHFETLEPLRRIAGLTTLRTLHQATARQPGRRGRRPAR